MMELDESLWYIVTFSGLAGHKNSDMPLAITGKDLSRDLARWLAAPTSRMQHIHRVNRDGTITRLTVINR